MADKKSKSTSKPRVVHEAPHPGGTVKTGLKNFGDKKAKPFSKDKK